MSDLKYENWEQSDSLEPSNVMTGYADKKTFGGIKRAADELGLVETLHKETKRGLIHFTFREPKPSVTSEKRA